MSIRLRLVLMMTMIMALFFGFLHLFIPGESLYNFERLHIFLFNLVSGGTILIYYSENQKKMSKKTMLFFGLSITYALLAFKKIYMPAVVISFILAGIVEIIRFELFSLFPWGFFDRREPVSRKFHQASLLCLSMGLIISGLVIVNNQYLHLVCYEKLKLDTFFLGFSFPLSLITMSVIFSFMKGDTSRLIVRLKNAGFWNVNIGVIIFFMFILFGQLIPQLVVTTILFMSVVLIYYLYKDLGERVQQKNFLTSGMFFLWYTAVTGIIYVALEFKPDYSHEKMKYLLRMHSFASLYGWNLSGLAVICRKDEFPIRMHSPSIIAIHWITAIFLAPLGTWFRPLALVALGSYIYILYVMLFSKGGEVILKPERANTG